MDLLRYESERRERLMERKELPLPSARLRHIPPAAVPTTAGDLLRGAGGALFPDAARARLRAQICHDTGADSCLLTSSARAALTIILLTLRRLSPRRQVIVPAYSCPSVVQAIQAAELIPVFCDISPRTLALDRRQLEELAEQDPLAIVPTHLYGLVHEMGHVLETARACGIFVVEDAAQAFGAASAGQMVGTSGDFGLFSLGRGKCVPAGHGGVLLSKAQYAAAVAETITRIGAAGKKRGTGALVAFLGYGVATTPTGWWFITRSPLNPANAGTDVKQLPLIQLGGLSGAHAGIASAILSRLEQITALRRHNAGRLLDLLSPYQFVTAATVSPHSRPAYLRFPLVVDTADRANTLYRLLSAAGIGVSRSYTRTLPELFSPHLSPCERTYAGATHVARCLLTLPTHHYLRERDLQTVERIFAHVDGDKE